MFSSDDLYQQIPRNLVLHDRIFESNILFLDSSFTSSFHICSSGHLFGIAVMYLTKVLDWGSGFQHVYKQIDKPPEDISFHSRPQKSVKWKLLLELRYLYWCIIGLLLLVVVYLLFDKHRTSNRMKSWGSYEKGFATDFGELTHPFEACITIKLEPRNYRFNETESCAIPWLFLGRSR